MPGSYGTFVLQAGRDFDDGRPRWRLTGVAPHVTKTILRIFPRTQNKGGALLLPDTLDMARDLRWLFDRWPMVPGDGTSLAHLESQATLCQQHEETRERILSGQHTEHGWREPARQPRPYQLPPAQIVHTTGRLLLADQVGLGKTMSSLLVLRNPDTLPAVIVTLANLPAQWHRELQATLPWLRGHVISSKQPYNITARMDDGRDPDVLFISYNKLWDWCDHLAELVTTIIFDEIQELRRGDLADKGRAAAIIAERARYRMGLTATLIYNYGIEAYNIISVLEPGFFGDRGDFTREWIGDTAKGKVADPRALGAHLRDAGMLLRRTRSDVGRELPEAIRIEQPVETRHDVLDQLTGDIEAMARLVLDHSANPQARQRAGQALEARIRQATGIAKAPYVAEFVRLLLQSEERVVLFGWHRAVYDIWTDALREFRPVLYTGSETAAVKEQNAKAFTHGESRVLMMSVRSGVGLDGLQHHCKVAVFGELDWTPAIHEQAIGRLHRDGQPESVVAYFMLSDDGSDPTMAEVLDLKRQQAEPIINPDVELVEPADDDGGLDRIRALATDVLRRRGQRPPAAAADATGSWTQPALLAVR